MNKQTVLSILVLLVAIAVSVQGSILIYNNQLLTAQASSSVSICVNQDPIISFDCNTTLTQDVEYTCVLNVTDPDNDGLTYNVTVQSGNVNVTVIQNGTYVILPNASQLGNQTIEFSVQDDKGCINGYVTDTQLLTVENVNDAPVYLGGIESPLTFAEGISLRGIFLDEYFYDIDGDELNFSSSVSNGIFSIVISSASEIIVSSSECGEAEVVFTAIDPFNATGSSSVIELSVPCPQETSSGGGGGSSSSSECFEQWRCEDWSRCYRNGTQQQTCRDIRGCDPNDYIRYFWRECQYLPHCENGILDFDEQGIDCGGSCPACQTCEDNILNNDEVEIDCGGPNCPACQNCFDGIQNYEEEGVDCGGPYCIECASCFDNIQNQNETGVDCGGPCAPCSRLETPDTIFNRRDTINAIIIGLVAAVVIGFIVYKLFKKQLALIFSQLMWMMLRNKQKEILLQPHQVDELYTDLRKLEDQNLLDHNRSRQFEEFQESLAQIVRRFFAYLVGQAVERKAVAHKISSIKTTDRVKHILTNYYDMLIELEKKRGLKPTDLKIQLELFRQQLLSLSDIDKKKLSRSVEEMDLHKKDFFMRCKQVLYNATLAIQFEEIELGKRKYIEALKIYNNLNPKQQEDLYVFLHLTFDSLLYVASYKQIY